MSFYDDSTVRKNKQIILDSCPMENTPNTPLPLPISKSSNKNISKLSAEKIRHNLKN
jgi:hypothetical protein